MATKKQGAKSPEIPAEETHVPSPADTLLEDVLKNLDALMDTWQAPVSPSGKAKKKNKDKSEGKSEGKGGGKAKTFRLDGCDPDAKPFSTGDKLRDRAAIEALAGELDGLQNLFYADKRYKLLVILQGTDTSGKDGTLRGVFSRMTPLGVHTVGWKAPSDEERSHDYLWRIHQKMPPAGEIMVFNRSHYEDVLVPPVLKLITPEQTAQRYAQINDFERMLSENGTVVLKFMLHIGFEEQRIRLQERIDDVSKNWKFAMGDLDARKQWKDYQQAYEDLLNATSTPWAPWTVVPANSKTHRNLMIATLLRHAMQKLDLRYPPPDPKLKGLKVS